MGTNPQYGKLSAQSNLSLFFCFAFILCCSYLLFVLFFGLWSFVSLLTCLETLRYRCSTFCLTHRPSSLTHAAAVLQSFARIGSLFIVDRVATLLLSDCHSPPVTCQIIWSSSGARVSALFQWLQVVFQLDCKTTHSVIKVSIQHFEVCRCGVLHDVVYIRIARLISTFVIFLFYHGYLSLKAHTHNHLPHISALYQQ